MIRLAALRNGHRGSAAVEMALVLPLLLVIMFGSVEMGNYFYDEHKLAKAVRDGARFAARQRFGNYAGCTGVLAEPFYTQTKTIVRKGSLNTADSDLLPNWDHVNTTFSVTMSCQATLDLGGGNTPPPSGIYAGMTGGAPKVTVTASLPYQPAVGSAFGFSPATLTLNATQQAAVVGL